MDDREGGGMKTTVYRILTGTKQDKNNGALKRAILSIAVVVIFILISYVVYNVQSDSTNAVQKDTKSNILMLYSTVESNQKLAKESLDANSNLMAYNYALLAETYLKSLNYLYSSSFLSDLLGAGYDRIQLDIQQIKFKALRKLQNTFRSSKENFEKLNNIN